MVCLQEGPEGSKRVKILKMNEMLFVFSHSEKVKYKGKPCTNFLLKGGIDDTFLKVSQRWDPDNILGFKKGKMLKIDEMLFVFSHI
jgi:hypothetical protein